MKNLFAAFLAGLVVFLLFVGSPVTADSGIKVVATYDVGRAPHGSRIDGDTILIALSGEDAIVRIDLKTGEEIARWPVADVPLGITKSKNGWLVAMFRGEAIVELNGETGREVNRWSVGKSPSLFTPKRTSSHLHDAGLTYVVSEFGDQFTVIDPENGAIVKTYATGNRPYPADVTSDGVLAFIPNRDENTVSVIDLLREIEVAHTPVCANPEGGALVEGENTYMVACGGADEVQLINTASFEVIGSITAGIGKRPFSVAPSTDGRFAFVNNAGGDTVSVIDVASRSVVDEITVGKMPIVMRAHENRLYVTNEISGTLSVLEIPPAPASPNPGLKNEVVTLSMIHSGHTNSERYGLDYLYRLFKAVEPDVVLVEIPPNRMEATMKGFIETGEIQEPRSKRFPEYVGALFPLWRETRDFKLIGTAGWNTHMNLYRRDALNRIRDDASRKAEWDEYQAAIQKGSEAIGEKRDDPYFMNSEGYYAIGRAQYEPYDRLFNNELGTGGWTVINEAHYGNVEKALDKLSGQGKRIMITYGAAHIPWFLNELRKRADIELLDQKPFLDAANGK